MAQRGGAARCGNRKELEHELGRELEGAGAELGLMAPDGRGSGGRPGEDEREEESGSGCGATERKNAT
jgi:hypothetical protein